ncbi:MAG: hypothetical protein M0036_15315 [Desulfobacteraceae bacterium]|nr:hypothetical protein [Desulfobacteraceae bacterium]
MQISTTDINQLSSAAIDQRLQGPAGPFFRRAFLMRFQTGGSPEALRIDPGAAGFEAAFTSKIYNALDAAGPVPAQTRQLDANTVAIELDRPWRIARIRLKSSYGNRFLTSEYSAEYYWACAAAPDHVDVEIEADAYEYETEAQMSWQQMVTLQLFRVDGQAVAAAPTASVACGASITDDFITAAFAIRAVDASNNPMTLNLSDISAIEIETFPTGPRVGLCDPASLPAPTAPEIYFWQLPGEIRDATAFNAPNTEAATAFAGALQRHFDARLEVMAKAAQQAQAPYAVPEYLEVALVVDSDAPCQSTIDLSVGYDLLRASFALPGTVQGIRDKQVLRFQGQDSPCHSLSISLPAAARLIHAVVEMDASFGIPPATPVGPGLEPIPQGLNHGVRLETNRWAAQPVCLNNALALNEIALGVMALGKGTELLVTLRLDHAGMPDGAVVFEQQVSLDGLGRRGYARLPLDQTVFLSAQKYWIMAKTLSGSAVWLTSTDAQSAIVLHQATASGGVSATLAAVNGVRGYHCLFARTASTTADVPVTLNVGGRVVRLAPLPNGRLQTDADDLAAAISSMLAAPEAAAPLMSLDLKFTATVKGFLTVYAPGLVYDLSVS